ncbi:hypothetical protein [Gordonibacter pamelaeae]|uniref:hypothetical protein n=1 Tax=Gordonibacter pamelaeae TaxID=471189 RepID=UPI003A900675
MGPAQSYALSSLKPQLYPHGVTIVSTSFQIAGCAGSSLFVGVLSSVQAAQLAGGAADRLATAAGFQAACLVAMAVAVAGFALSLALGRLEKRRVVQQAAAPTAAPAASEA